MGFSLAVAEEDLTDLEDGEFYYREIIGLDVYENDQLIGQIKANRTKVADTRWSNAKGNVTFFLPYILTRISISRVIGRWHLRRLDDED